MRVGTVLLSLITLTGTARAQDVCTADIQPAVSYGETGAYTLEVRQPDLTPPSGWYVVLNGVRTDVGPVAPVMTCTAGEKGYQFPIAFPANGTYTVGVIPYNQDANGRAEAALSNLITVTIVAAPPPPPPPSTLRTAAEADFNGDLKADLLWRRIDGAIALWNMNGLTSFAQVALNPGVVDPVWKIVGTGDLDANGRPEIIWQKTNGELCAWSMDGAMMRAWGYLNPRYVDPAWQVLAVADLNGDSRADIILQNTSGALVVWYMRGVDMTRFVYLTPSTPGDRSWRVVGAGDLNGDGKPDLVLQHQVSRDLVVWFMNGATMQSWGYLSPRAASGSDWTVGAVVDLNGDGKSDLVWQHTSGTVAAWLMNGTRAVTMPALSPATVATGWHLAAPK